MSILGFRMPVILMLSCILVVSGCASIPRIDGTSDDAFDRSHAKLIESLAPGDRLRLSLAEATVLSPRHCASMKPITGSPLLTKVLGGQSDIKGCRRELNGLSFQDIISLAYPHGDGNASQP